LTITNWQRSAIIGLADLYFAYCLLPVVNCVLSLCGGPPEIHGDLYIFQVLDLAIGSLKTLDIFRKGLHKTLGVLGR
jgi:hypothetical protein